MQIHELLDRFELLYPENEGISNLRRSVIDKELSSIFKIVTDNNKEDLRKLVLEQNIWKLWPLLEGLVNTQFVAAFKNFVVNDISINSDCFSRGQLQSKLWLVNELKKQNVDLGTVFICAGWYGTLATMLFESGLNVDKIRSFDIDETCVEIAETFNKPWFTEEWKFKSITQDIMDIDYNNHTWKCWSTKNNRMSYPITDTPNTIINTSCEHIKNFTQWYNMIPNGKLVILQSNDYFGHDEHVNCCIDLDDFNRQTPMREVIFKDTLDLEKYKRFMKIGYK